MVKISEGIRAIKAAGFELEYHEDLAQRGDEIPWYYPIAGDMKYCRSISDLFTVLRMTTVGRGAVHKLVGALEMIGVAPKGTQKTADTLAVAADCLVAGAKVRPPTTALKTPHSRGLHANCFTGEPVYANVHDDCEETFERLDLFRPIDRTIREKKAECSGQWI